MTAKEFGILADSIKTYFPRDNMFPTKESVALWYEELKDLDYKSASAELKKYVATNKFAPTISDIRECLIDFGIGYSEIGSSDAWELVLKTIDDAQREGLATKRFQSLPEAVQKAVGGRLQFLELMDYPVSKRVSEKAEFVKRYASAVDRERELAKLQPDIRNLIAGKDGQKNIESVPDASGNLIPDKTI